MMMAAASGYRSLLGQEKAKSLLDRALRSDRLPHAMLFRGPEGVGKQLFARGVAAVVNCRNKTSPTEACGSCTSCKKYLSGNHPDFMLVQPEKGAIKIGSVREICKSLTYPPYESVMRVVLLEDVHTMRQEAANALLKTLEEPPANNLLILTADTSQEVLATILSRCQVVPFFGLSEEQTVSIVMQDTEEIVSEEATVLARLSEGSPGKALRYQKAGLLKVLTSFIGFTVNPESKNEKSIAQALKIAEEMASLKEDLTSFLGLLRIWYRDLLYFVHGQEDRVAENELLHGHAKRSQKYWSSEELFAKLQAIDKAEDELARNCNRSLVCEVLIFSLQ